MAEIYNKVRANTPKAQNALGENTIPSTFEFISVIMINRDGEQRDIASLVIGFDVVEELYSPYITAKIRIHDISNFFEEFKLSGQEIIKLKVRKNKGNSSEELEFIFATKDYPDFEKTTESINVQEYNINAISVWAYLSRLQQISRSVKGNPTDIIKDIFTKDLAYPNFDDSKNTHPSVTQFKAVITKRTPIQAINWLKTKAFDQEQTPFFVYPTIIDNKIIIRSWSSIVASSNPIYPSESKPYKLKPYAKTSPSTPEYLEEELSKIISMKSNPKLDKLQQALDGGFGNIINVIDFTNRDYRQNRNIERGGVEIPEESSGKDKGFDFLTNAGINAGAFQERVKACEKHFYEPMPLNDDGWKSSREIKLENYSKELYYRANLESSVHEVTLYGDFQLNPGKKIKIEIPKALDPINEEGLDASLSGIYIIALSVHSFRNGVYVNRLKLIKDNA